MHPIMKLCDSYKFGTVTIYNSSERIEYIAPKDITLIQWQYMIQSEFISSDILSIVMLTMHDAFTKQ